MHSLVRRSTSIWETRHPQDGLASDMVLEERQRKKGQNAKRRRMHLDEGPNVEYTRHRETSRQDAGWGRNDRRKKAEIKTDGKDDSDADVGIGLPSSSFTGMSNPKNAFDAVSRRSTAMSNDGLTEHGTPGQGSAGVKMSGRTESGKLRWQNSNKVRNSNGEMGGTNAGKRRSAPRRAYLETDKFEQ